MSQRDDEARLSQFSEHLAAALERHIGPWIIRLLAERSAGRIDDERAHQVATAVAALAVPAVRTLLSTDIDHQRSNPLAIVRGSLAPATEALRSAGIEPVSRDPFVEASFPDDHYGLAPAGFIDIAEELHEPGLLWGAAKAHVHLARRRA